MLDLRMGAEQFYNSISRTTPKNHESCRMYHVHSKNSKAESLSLRHGFSGWLLRAPLSPFFVNAEFAAT